MKFGPADSFLINKLTSKQFVSSIKAHEMCILNKDLKLDKDIIDLMNQFLFSKLKDRMKLLIMDSNDIDEKLEPELVAQINIEKFTLLEECNFPTIVPSIYDYGVIDFERKSKDSEMI